MTIRIVCREMYMSAVCMHQPASVFVPRSYPEPVCQAVIFLEEHCHAQWQASCAPEECCPCVGLTMILASEALALLGLKPHEACVQFCHVHLMRRPSLSLVAYFVDARIEEFL